MYYKKLLAVVLAATMVLGSSAMVFAKDMEDGQTGSGSTEFVAKGDVFDVVFPTIADDSTMFDYVVDPNGLIAATGGDKYAGKKIEKDKTVYFLRTEEKPLGNALSENNVPLDYTDTSDEIKVINKSTDDVTLEVKAELTAVEGIEMASSTAFGTAGPELYLAIVGTDGTTPDTPLALDAESVSTNKVIPKDPAAYEITWNETAKQYEKALTAAAKADGYAGFKSYSFQLTGACNNHADWAALKDKAPQVDLVWSVKDTITGDDANVYAMTNGANGNIIYDFTEKPAGSITAVKINGTDRMGVVRAGNITYNSTTGRFIVQGVAATNTGLANGGTVEVTIGSQTFTLRYTK